MDPEELCDLLRVRFFDDRNENRLSTSPPTMQDERAPIDPARVRRVPRSGFGWIDRRWIHERWLERLEQEEILLYVFLALAGDKNGMSYWDLETIAERLALDVHRVESARHGLLQHGLILFRYPKWQIIDLPEPSKRLSPRN
jgi:hypothetical protein